MRIVAGLRRGARLAAPEGLDIRPTSDRVRESLFGVLEGGRFGDVLEEALVVDAFAGTGALGLEALSRGAATVLFMEMNREACRVLRQNIAKLGMDKAATVVEGDALRLRRTAPEAARLVLLDPPYGSGLAGPCLERLREFAWLSAGTLAVVETAKAEDPVLPDWLSIADERRYGRTRLTFAVVE
jgi:16S rRNA (guanine966-N2)-methyltransferase